MSVRGKWRPLLVLSGLYLAGLAGCLWLVKSGYGGWSGWLLLISLVLVTMKAACFVLDERFHWQNLAYDRRTKLERSAFWSGRAWSQTWPGHCCIEWRFGWAAPDIVIGPCRFHFSFLLGKIYLSWQRDDDHQSNCLQLSWHNGGFWLTPWNGVMHDYSRDDPWYKRTYHWDVVRTLLGKTTYQREVLETHYVLIPMHEGCYRARLELDRCTWRRPRWRAVVQLGCNLDIPGGIPFMGKGENSWDCGEDGLHGMSCGAKTVPEAIAAAVESVLTSRQKYGTPQRISETPAVIRNQGAWDDEYEPVGNFTFCKRQRQSAVADGSKQA